MTPAGRCVGTPRRGSPLSELPTFISPAAGARRGDRIDIEDLSAPARPCCVATMGCTLHPDVAVPARDRRRLERLCRYVARPPVATDRLGRLVPLIPAPRAHQVRYHGVLAPCAGWRERVVPAGPHPGELARPTRCHNALSGEPSPGAEVGDGARSLDLSAAAPSSAPENRRPMRRYAWADLLRRVFAVDVLECPDCGGPMRILAAIHPPDATRAILECLGLPSRAPPATARRSDPEPPEPAPSDW